jgi:hypothetical protein
VAIIVKDQYNCSELLLVTSIDSTSTGLAGFDCATIAAVVVIKPEVDPIEKLLSFGPWVPAMLKVGLVEVDSPTYHATVPTVDPAAVPTGIVNGSVGAIICPPPVYHCPVTLKSGAGGPDGNGGGTLLPTHQLFIKGPGGSPTVGFGPVPGKAVLKPAVEGLLASVVAVPVFVIVPTGPVVGSWY